MKRMPINCRKLIAPCALLVLLVAEMAAIKALGLGGIMQAGIPQPVKHPTYFEPGIPSEGSLQELYQDVLMTMLTPYIDEAVSKYYEENTGLFPIVYPYGSDVLSIERPDGYRTFEFVIKLEVTPYLGAHHPIGKDRITIRVSPAEVKVEKFEHLESYPIPPRLQ